MHAFTPNSYIDWSTTFWAWDLRSMQDSDDNDDSGDREEDDDDGSNGEAEE